MGDREEGRQTSCFSSILFQVFYHAINLHLKYMCQCDVLLFSGDLFPQQNATWHEWTHVAYSVCLKKPALFLVFHHYTNNFNIHDSLAFVPQARALPPFSVYLLLPSSSTSFLLFFSVYCSPWITSLLPDSLSSSVLNGALEKAACLLLRERALISLAESSSRSAPRGKLRNAACRGGRWDRTFFWSFLAPFNLSIKVG